MSGNKTAFVHSRFFRLSADQKFKAALAGLKPKLETALEALAESQDYKLSEWSETSPHRWTFPLTEEISVELCFLKLPPKTNLEAIAKHLKAAHQTAGPARGHITSTVHPDDPLKELYAAGFESFYHAARFVEAGFRNGAAEPAFSKVLRRGDRVRFEGAPYVVFYRMEKAKPVLLSITRLHSDLAITAGSCGYQLLLGVQLA